MEFYLRVARNGIRCASDELHPTDKFVAPLSTYNHYPPTNPSKRSKPTPDMEDTCSDENEDSHTPGLSTKPNLKRKPGLPFNGEYIGVEEPHSNASVHNKPVQKPIEDEGPDTTLPGALPL